MKLIHELISEYAASFPDKTALSVAEVSAILLNMELSGLVRQLPGKVYVIC